MIRGSLNQEREKSPSISPVQRTVLTFKLEFICNILHFPSELNEVDSE